MIGRARMAVSGNHRIALLTAGFFLTIWCTLAVMKAGAGETTRVSVDNVGNQGNGASGEPSISGDGRYVAFSSAASNLVARDTNGTWDVFVRDRQTGQTTRVSVDNVGNQGNGASVDPSISADGRYVAFMSEAPNLVPGDTNGTWDVLVRDRQAGRTTRVSVDSVGNQGNAASGGPSISAYGRYVAFYSYSDDLAPGDTNGTWDIFLHDRQTGQIARMSVFGAGNQEIGAGGDPSSTREGRYVAFSSDASDLVWGDTNGSGDVFVHDRQTGQTTRVSVDNAGNQVDNNSDQPAIGAFGRYVAFSSAACDLVAGDTNGTRDIFVHDRQTGQTTRVSVDNAGSQGNGASGGPSISGDGKFVAFSSAASNLVAGDTNGYPDIFVRDIPAAAGGESVNRHIISVSIGDRQLKPAGDGSSLPQWLDLILSNSGPGNATHVWLESIVFKTLSGSGAVTCDAALWGTLPLLAGSLAPGGTTTVRIHVKVPSTVQRFQVTETFGIGDELGFSDLQVSQTVFP